LLSSCCFTSQSYGINQSSKKSNLSYIFRRERIRSMIRSKFKLHSKYLRINIILWWSIDLSGKIMRDTSHASHFKFWNLENVNVFRILTQGVGSGSVQGEKHESLEIRFRCWVTISSLPTWKGIHVPLGTSSIHLML